MGSPTESPEPVDADRLAAANGGGQGRSPAHRRRGARSGWIGRLGGVPVVAGVAVVLLVVPMLFLIIPLLTYHGVFSNWGDNAATELSVQNAVGLHQTVGPYDRFGWYHPGPMYFYLLAIPYVAMSWSGAALPVGATLINLAAVIGIVVLVARRLGSTAAVATAALVCGFEVLMQPYYLTNAWGPIIILLPTAFFLVLGADLAAGGVVPCRGRGGRNLRGANQCVECAGRGRGPDTRPRRPG